MKKIILTVFVFSFILNYNILAQQNEHADEKYEVIAKVTSDGHTYYGEDIKSEIETVQIKDLYADPEKYKGKNVTIEGDVTGVCQNMGCWLLMSDGEKEVRVMTLHKFFMPKDLGKVRVITQGEFGTKELTEEQAKHYAKEQGVNGDNIKGPQMMYFIKTSGVKVVK